MGFSVPVLVGKGNVIIDGTTSIKAAEELGLTEAPAWCLTTRDMNTPFKKEPADPR